MLKTSPFDVSKYIKTQEDRLELIKDAFETWSSDDIDRALRIALKGSVHYPILEEFNRDRDQGSLKLLTVMTALKNLGFKITIEPVETVASSATVSSATSWDKVRKTAFNIFSQASADQMNTLGVFIRKGESMGVEEPDCRLDEMTWTFTWPLQEIKSPIWFKNFADGSFECSCGGNIPYKAAGTAAHELVFQDFFKKVKETLHVDRNVKSVE